MRVCPFLYFRVLCFMFKSGCAKALWESECYGSTALCVSTSYPLLGFVTFLCCFPVHRITRNVNWIHFSARHTFPNKASVKNAFSMLSPPISYSPTVTTAVETKCLQKNLFLGFPICLISFTIYRCHQKKKKNVSGANVTTTTMWHFYVSH